MSAAMPHESVGTGNRHGRAADALISSYLRELMADDEVDSPLALQEQSAEAASQPAAARGRNAAA